MLIIAFTQQTNVMFHGVGINKREGGGGNHLHKWSVIVDLWNNKGNMGCFGHVQRQIFMWYGYLHCRSLLHLSGLASRNRQSINLWLE